MPKRTPATKAHSRVLEFIDTTSLPYRLHTLKGAALKACNIVHTQNCSLQPRLKQKSLFILGGWDRAILLQGRVSCLWYDMGCGIWESYSTRKTLSQRLLPKAHRQQYKNKEAKDAPLVASPTPRNNLNTPTSHPQQPKTSSLQPDSYPSCNSSPHLLSPTPNTHHSRDLYTLPPFFTPPTPHLQNGQLGCSVISQRWKERQEALQLHHTMKTMKAVCAPGTQILSHRSLAECKQSAPCAES